MFERKTLHLTYRHFLQDDDYLRMALMERSGGGTSDSYEGEAKGEEEEEEWGDDTTWGYGVRDASWMDGPSGSNPKEEMKEEDWNGGGGGGGGWKRPWGRHGWEWGGKYEENEKWSSSTSWKTKQWDGGWQWHQKNNKPPWAYSKSTPNNGRYVKGGYEADGVFYESL